MYRSRGPRGFFCLQVVRRVPVIVDVITLGEHLAKGIWTRETDRYRYSRQSLQVAALSPTTLPYADFPPFEANWQIASRWTKMRGTNWSQFNPGMKVLKRQLKTFVKSTDATRAGFAPKLTSMVGLGNLS